MWAGKDPEPEIDERQAKTGEFAMERDFFRKNCVDIRPEENAHDRPCTSQSDCQSIPVSLTVIYG